MATRLMPPWAEEIRATYLRGESSVFIVHGNVFDQILHDGKLTPVVDFIAGELLKTKDVIVHYNPSVGIKFRKKDKKIENLDTLFGVREKAPAIAALDTLLLTQDRVAVIIDYAEMIAPTGTTAHLLDDDRRTIVTMHRWSLDRRFDHSDNIVLLVTEQLAELNPTLVSNPKITAVRIPLPTREERLELTRLIDREATEKVAERIADLSAGLKLGQLQGLLAPGEDNAEDEIERYEYIQKSLAGQHDAKERAKKFAKLTAGYSRARIDEYLLKKNITPPARDNTPDPRYEDVFKLLAQRKREILEKECYGLIEFVEPAHDFSAVGGMEGVKAELMAIARNIREGDRSRVPMGLLFTGPMGTGKTFVAEAFAKSSGLTAIKLKNFRSKWVGATEGNLEKILGVVKAIGNILVIIDEGDRSFGNADGEGDGGTSSRVIARIKEFMSDTTNRGRVLFVLMTNRPDKLDIDIKRAGRLDRKIPFFYAQDAEEVEPVLKAQLRRHKVEHDLELPRDRAAVSARLVGYSNADIEAVVLLAHDFAETQGSRVTVEIMDRALKDYMPSRDATMLEYMELQAVFEASSRSMLPKRYRDIDIDEMQRRIEALKLRIR